MECRSGSERIRGEPAGSVGFDFSELLAPVAVSFHLRRGCTNACLECFLIQFYFGAPRRESYRSSSQFNRDCPIAIDKARNKADSLPNLDASQATEEDHQVERAGAILWLFTGVAIATKDQESSNAALSLCMAS